MNLANVAMGAASLVVGQYYMKQINAELLEMNNGISRISEFAMNTKVSACAHDTD